MNTTEVTNSAGKVSLMPLKPSKIHTSKKGTLAATIGKVVLVARDTPSAVTPSSLNVSTIATGIPIAPHAPAAALATKHSIAACNGLKPSAASITLQMAIGTPKPAAPSKNAPKQKPISNNWMRWSAETMVSEPLMTSILPVATVKR